MSALVVFWTPIIIMLFAGLLVGFKSTYVRAGHQAMPLREWLARPARFALGFGALGLPVGFFLYIVANSGL